MYKFYHDAFSPTIEGGGGKENKQKIIGAPDSASPGAPDSVFSVGSESGEAGRMRWYNGEEIFKKKGSACVFGV